MGNSQPHPLLSLYSQSQHPIFGQITAYKLKTQAAKFIMKTRARCTKQQLQLYETIGREQFSKIIVYYGCDSRILHLQGTDMNGQSKVNGIGGKIRGGQQLGRGQSQFRQMGVQRQYQLYWEFLNFNLDMYIQNLRVSRQHMPEQQIWQILENMLKSCMYLKKFSMYPQLTPKHIYFSSGKQPKLHWCNLQPNNRHLPYERFINCGQFRHSIYAPQQLLQMSRSQRKELDRERIVIFMLGIVLLELMSKCETRRIYDYHKKMFSQVKKRQYLAMIDGNLKTKESEGIKRTMTTKTSFQSQQKSTKSHSLISVQQPTIKKPSSLNTTTTTTTSVNPNHTYNQQLKHKYSEQLLIVLDKLLEYFPRDRFNYEGLERRLDRHYKRNGFQHEEVLETSSNNNGLGDVPVVAREKEKEDKKSNRINQKESIFIQCFKHDDVKFKKDKQKNKKDQTQKL